MGCQIKRNSKGEIEEVKAANGEKSIAYDSLLSTIEYASKEQFARIQVIYKSWIDNGIIKGLNAKEIALGMYTRMYGENFIKFFGNWVDKKGKVSKHIDKNGEPLIVDGKIVGLDDIQKSIFGTSTSKAVISYEDKKIFSKEVGLYKKEIDVSRRLEFQRRADLYNKKHGTSLHIKWAPVGQSNLLTYTIEDYTVQASTQLSGQEFKSRTDDPVETEKNKELNNAIWQGLWNFYSDGKKTSMASDVLKRITGSTNYLSGLAAKILENNHNDVPVHFLSREEFVEYVKNNNIKFYDVITDINTVEAFYTEQFNEIIIVAKPTSKLTGNIIEEVVHALTVNFLKGNSTASKEWEELFEKTKKKFKDEGISHYYLTNKYEFLAGVLRDFNFMKLLATKPSESKWYLNYFHEIFNFLLNTFTEAYGLNFKERTLLHDVFESASRVIVQSVRETDYLESDEFNYVASAISEEESDAIKDNIHELSTELENVVNNTNTARITDELYEAISKRAKKIEEHKSYKDIKDLYKGSKEINKLQAITEQLEKASAAPATEIGAKRRARATASAIVQIGYLLDITIPHIKEIIKDTDNSVENIHTLQYYLYMLQDWEAVFSEAKELLDNNPKTKNFLTLNLSKIEDIYKDIAKNDETGIVATLKPILVPAGEKFSEWATREEATVIKLLRGAESRGDTRAIEYQNKRLLDLRASKQAVDFKNDKAILNFLKGAMGDTNVFSAYLEAFRDSPDPIVGSFTAFVKRNLDEVGNEIATLELRFEQALAPIYAELGGRFDAESLTREIIYYDERVNSKGEIYVTPSYLNPFKNYKVQEKLYKNAIYALEEKVDSDIATEEEKQELIEQKKLYAKWRVKNMHNPFIDRYYEKYELWDDEVGQLLKVDVDRIFNLIDSIQEPHTFIGSELSKEELDQIDAYYKEYIYLGNITNLDGTPKTGVEEQKALRMKKMRALNVEFYEYKDDVASFEKARIDHQDSLLAAGILEGSVEFRDAMYKWKEENTRTYIDQAYYQEREAKIRKLKILMDRAPDAIVKNSKLAPLYKEMIDQVYGLRDEDGQPIGDEITAAKTKRLKEIQEEIEAERQKFSGFSGLTDDEKDELSALFDKKEARGLNVAETAKFNALLDQSASLKMHSSDRLEIIKLFSDLRNMQSRICTPYYVQSFNNVSTRLGVTLDSRGNIEEDGNFIDILESNKLFRLLEDPTFKSWFLANHLQVLKYDKESGGKIPKWERLFQWSKVVPSNPDFIKEKPAYKYSIRRVKDEFRTKRELNKTVDIKGDWLPKTVEEGGNSEYRNEKYYELKEAAEKGDRRSQLLWEYLVINVSTYLDIQKNAAKQNRLGFDLSKVNKEEGARNLDLLRKPLQLPGLMWDRFITFLSNLNDYSVDSGNYEEIDGELVGTNHELVYADKYGTELNSIPMKFINFKEAKNISLNSPRSIMKYAYANATNRKLVEISPIARTLQRVLDNPKNAPIDPTKKIRGRRFISPLLGTNNRKKAIDFLIKREFEGHEKAYELGKGKIGRFFDSMVSILKKMGSYSYLKFNIPSSIANVVNAVNQNIITSGNGYYSLGDYAKGGVDFYKRFTPAWQKDYWMNDLGKRTLETQMADRWEFMQSMSIGEIVGERYSSNKVKDFVGMNWMFNHREWGEFFVQSRVWLAFLNGTKITQTLSDGSEVVLALKDIYELDADGIIKIKDGIDKEWGFSGAKYLAAKNLIQKTIRGTHGAYANFDKAMAEQYTSYNFAIFLKKWFIAMFLQRFAANNVSASFKGGITSTPRFNTDAGTHWGYYMAALNGISKQWQSGITNWGVMTPEEKASMWRAGQEVMVVLAASFIIRVLARIDYDDRDPYSALKDMSWWELQMLYQVMRLQVETETYVSPTQYKDFTLNFMASEAAAKWGKLLMNIITQEEYKQNTKDHDIGDKKWPTQFKRAVGLQGLERFYDDPEDLIKQYDKTIRPHI